MSTDHFVKLARAQQHLAVLEKEIDEIKDHAIRCVGGKDVKARQLVISIVVSPVPTLWGLLAGDCLYNMRASLDHLVYSIARDTRGAPPKGTKIAFPVFLTRAGFEKRAPEMIKDLPAEARSIIEGLQPFNGTNGKDPRAAAMHPLWPIHTLNNIDKHRHISVGWFASPGVSWSCDTKSKLTNEYMRQSLKLGYIDQERTELLRADLKPDGSVPAIKLKLMKDVSFSNTDLTGDLSIRGVLNRGHNYIRDRVFPPLNVFLK